jgi:hypothetical protein
MKHRQTIIGIVVSWQAQEDAMDSTRVPQQRPSIVLVVVCLLVMASALTFGGQRALATPAGCKTVRGHFFPSQIEVDENPNTLEFTGPVTGTLAGTFLSTELVLLPGRPETPSVMLFTELLTFTTKHGTVLKTTGVGSFDTDPHAAGLFTEILTIIEKDGQPGQFGQLFAFGSFDFAQNLGSAEYKGEVCD